MLISRSRSGCTEGAGAGQCIAALNGDGNPLPEETGFTPVPRDHSHATTQLRNEKLSLVAPGSERFEREGDERVRWGDIRILGYLQRLRRRRGCTGAFCRRPQVRRRESVWHFLINGIETVIK